MTQMNVSPAKEASTSVAVAHGFDETKEVRGTWFVRVLREPLFHFLLLGAGLFALSYAFSRNPQAQQPDTILVSKQRLKNLILIFQRTWQRPPTQQELEGIVQEYVKEEVFYREALAMGLDRDDTLVRRRLRQKLEFVAEDIADAAEPGDQELQQYLDEHPQTYRVERRVTFAQVYLSRERRGESLVADSETLLSQLRSGAVEAAEAGDTSLLPYFHENLTEREIANIFGPEFAAQLIATQSGQWTGPLESAYGVHLVLLREKTAGRAPELDEVRQAVRRDWIAERRTKAKEDFFLSLLGKYNVVVEELQFPDDASFPGAKP
jgi:hypothetical protein